MKKEQHVVLGRYSLNKIRELFPQVNKVRDSKRGITVKVTAEDSKHGKRKDPAECALARACVREKIADGCIIGVGTTWLVKGDTAIRYKTSAGVGREIVSFDRHHEFAAGVDYRLSRIAPSSRMGLKRANTKRGPGKKVRKPAHVHRTADIRVLR